MMINICKSEQVYQEPMCIKHMMLYSFPFSASLFRLTFTSELGSGLVDSPWNTKCRFPGSSMGSGESSSLSIRTELVASGA